MKSPDGELFPNQGCYLEVIKNKKLVWTNAVTEGFRPALYGADDFGITVTILLSGIQGGTVYSHAGLNFKCQG
jgi:hypothetical protein